MAWLLKKVKSSSTIGEAGIIAPVLPLHIARRLSPLARCRRCACEVDARLSEPPEVMTSGTPS